MKLCPTPKPVRIRLSVTSGDKKNIYFTLKDLQCNLDFNSIVPHIQDKSLIKWLEQIGEKDIARFIEARFKDYGYSETEILSNKIEIIKSFFPEFKGTEINDIRSLVQYLAASSNGEYHKTIDKLTAELVLKIYTNDAEIEYKSYDDLLANFDFDSLVPSIRNYSFCNWLVDIEKQEIAIEIRDLLNTSIDISEQKYRIFQIIFPKLKVQISDDYSLVIELATSYHSPEFLGTFRNLCKKIDKSATPKDFIEKLESINKKFPDSLLINFIKKETTSDTKCLINACLDIYENKTFNNKAYESIPNAKNSIQTLIREIFYATFSNYKEAKRELDRYESSSGDSRILRKNLTILRKSKYTPQIQLLFKKHFDLFEFLDDINNNRHVHKNYYKNKIDSSLMVDVYNYSAFGDYSGGDNIKYLQWIIKVCDNMCELFKEGSYE